jgi:hypothetical protein
MDMADATRDPLRRAYALDLPGVSTRAHGGGPCPGVLAGGGGDLPRLDHPLAVEAGYWLDMPIEPDEWLAAAVRAVSGSTSPRDQAACQSNVTTVNEAS